MVSDGAADSTIRLRGFPVELAKSYYVIGKDGRLYGPADLATLAGWAQTRRLKPDSILQDPDTGVSCRADSIPELYVALTSPAPHGGLGCLPALAIVAGAVALLIRHAV